MLALPWTNFFDDFITSARRAESESLSVMVNKFFKLVGWTVSSGEKDLPFSEKFKALGVEIDLTVTAWGSGEARFSNTPQRIAELTETISRVLESRKLPPQEALSLRGRMQFAHSQLWGRSAKLCLNAVTTHAYPDHGDGVCEKLAYFLGVFNERLKTSKPRVVTPSWDSPMFVFTDASFSPDDTSWPCCLGGVLLDCWGRQVAAFSYCLTIDELTGFAW